MRNHLIHQLKITLLAILAPSNSLQTQNYQPLNIANKHDECIQYTINIAV